MAVGQSTVPVSSSGEGCLVCVQEGDNVVGGWCGDATGEVVAVFQVVDQVLQLLELLTRGGLQVQEQGQGCVEISLGDDPGLVRSLDPLGFSGVGGAVEDVRLVACEVEADHRGVGLNDADVGRVNQEARKGFGHARVAQLGVQSVRISDGLQRTRTPASTKVRLGSLTRSMLIYFFPT